MREREEQIATARAELAAAREELLAQAPPRGGPRTEVGPSGDFPRSRAMRWLLSGAGSATLLAVIVALMALRPSFALGMIRRVPLPLLGRMVLTRLVARDGAPR